jgi:hypothetical protein
VIDGIHRHTANGRANAEPATTASFTKGLLVVIEVADDTNRSATFRINHAKLTRRHFERSLTVFDSHEFDGSTSGTGDLRTATGDELNRVDLGRGRD